MINFLAFLGIIFLILTISLCLVGVICHDKEHKEIKKDIEYLKRRTQLRSDEQA
jgi:hypothetical protein